MNTNQFTKLLAAIAILGVVGALFMWFRRPPAPITAHVPDTPRHDLVQTDGRWYWNGQTNPFTGWMTDVYPGGELLSRSQISNGLLNGLSETWYTNGQMEVREHFKNGVSHGLREKWHLNGNKMAETTLVSGKIEGVFRRWFNNGLLEEQIPMNHGHPDGIALAYYESGCLKAETRVERGEVIARRSWKDGEYREAPPE